MLDHLPPTADEFSSWPVEKIEACFQALLDCPLNDQSVHTWLRDWTRLSDLISEWYARLNVAVTADTTDAAAEGRYNNFLEQVYPKAQAADQKLKEKLLASGLEPQDFKIPLQRMRTEAEIFRTENLPLLSQERKLASQYNKIIGAQTIQWEGNEITLQQLRVVMQTPDRAKRETIWRLAAERQLEDRPVLNELWNTFFQLRLQMAANAGMSDYRAYRWKQMLRLDYTPQDCIRFQRAIEQIVVPAATRLYRRHSTRSNIPCLRPWDVDQDLYPLHFPPLPGYGNVDDLAEKIAMIFQRLDPQLGNYYRTMQNEGLLDLSNRKGKAPGAYCVSFPVQQRPFVFMNAVGLASDVRTLLHESGHAFHNCERLKLPYSQQRIPGLEFAEVASMAMELLATPYLSGGAEALFQEADGRRFQLAHLEHILAFWPYMAVVDAFQHWAYTHPEAAASAANCDACWFELWQRYLPGVDWCGLEDAAMTGWQRKQHIFRYPFYYVEYGLAQLGAVMVWRGALEDRQKALQAYRYGLSLGGTVSLPELYGAAGARLAFDEDTLAEAVQLVEDTIQSLECERQS